MDRAILRTCEPPHRNPSGRFITGNSGRPRGPNRVNRTLREAIVLAAAEHGSDGKGKGQLTGFLSMLIHKDLKSFVHLLGRCIPLNVVSTEEPERVFRSSEQVTAELEARGIGMLEILAERMAEREQRGKTNGGGSFNGSEPLH